MARPHRCDLNHTVTLQREVRTPDAAGGYALSWTSVADLAAEVLPLSGREQLHSMQLQARVTHRVTTRWREGVTPGMRLLFRGRPLNIQTAINLEEADRWLEMLCEEGAAT